jgi:hypothetical protein
MELTAEKTKQIENVALELERIVNAMGTDEATDLLVDKLSRMHRTLVQSFASKVIIKFILKLAENYESGWYDLRNEAACKACKTMKDAIIKAYNLDEDFIKKYGFNLPLI